MSSIHFHKFEFEDYFSMDFWTSPRGQSWYKNYSIDQIQILSSMLQFFTSLKIHKLLSVYCMIWLYHIINHIMGDVSRYVSYLGLSYHYTPITDQCFYWHQQAQITLNIPVNMPQHTNACSWSQASTFRCRVLICISFHGRNWSSDWGQWCVACSFGLSLCLLFAEPRQVSLTIWRYIGLWHSETM